jgi:hypothetical protein
LISVKKLFYNKLQINKRKDHNNNWIK